MADQSIEIFGTQDLLCGNFEVATVIVQPSQIEQTLIHELGRSDFLVLNDD